MQDEILEEMRKVTDGVANVIIYPNDGGSRRLHERQGFLTGLPRGNTEEGAKCVVCAVACRMRYWRRCGR